MSDEDLAENFHFLEEGTKETGNEFLRQRLTYLQEYFSYSELSGLSAGELERQHKLFKIMVEKTKLRYANPDFVFSDELEVYESLIDEELDLYEPLSEEQRMQIVSAINKINRNFDKAREDARDKKFERLSKVVSSVPFLNRVQRKP